MQNARSIPGRTALIVLDSVGCGFAPDAQKYGDEGAATLPHILEQCPTVELPNLRAAGLEEILALARGESITWSKEGVSIGVMTSATAGKDTTSGHWEIAGVPLLEPMPAWAEVPPTLRRNLEAATGVSFLANHAGSGTEIIARYGKEHLRTGHPILYTSADSVLQIAAHESLWPEEKLFALCQMVRSQADSWRIGRVIARPFTGEPGAFKRTAGRHDFSIEPPPTLLAWCAADGVPVTGVGKIADIFAGQGITATYSTATNAEGMQTIQKLWEARTPGLLFANLVDFDMLYGHRRDVRGYAHSLTEFDGWLGQFLQLVEPGDWVVVTADHGNDPTWTGTDHTRERVPLWVFHPGLGSCLGVRSSYADIAASLAERFSLASSGSGVSFAAEIPLF